MTSKPSTVIDCVAKNLPVTPERVGRVLNAAGHPEFAVTHHEKRLFGWLPHRELYIFGWRFGPEVTRPGWELIHAVDGIAVYHASREPLNSRQQAAMIQRYAATLRIAGFSYWAVWAVNDPCIILEAR